MTPVEIFSIASSIVSVALAIFAIWQSNESRRETQQNSTHIGEVLKDIEANSVRVKESLTRNEHEIRENIGQTQRSLMDMQKELVGVFAKRFEADIPQRVSPTDQALASFMSGMAQRPEEMISFLERFQESQKSTQNTTVVSQEQTPKQGS
jgi:hypothetical protein